MMAFYTVLAYVARSFSRMQDRSLITLQLWVSFTIMYSFEIHITLFGILDLICFYDLVHVATTRFVLSLIWRKACIRSWIHLIRMRQHAKLSKHSHSICVTPKNLHFGSHNHSTFVEVILKAVSSASRVGFIKIVYLQDLHDTTPPPGVNTYTCVALV